MKRYLSLVALSITVAGCGQSEAPKPVTQTPAAEAPAEAAAPQFTYEQLIASAEQLAQKRDFNSAVKTLTQAISQEPAKAEAFLKRAAICSEVNLMAQAIADMTTAIKIEPNNPKHLNTRGYFLLLSKQYDRAESDFSDAIGLDLQYAQPYNNRGLVWVAQGKYSEAVADFDNALKAKPDYLDAHNNRGFALLQAGELEKAVESFSSVLKRDPKYMNALTNRSQAYMKLNRPADAITDITTAIEIQPDQPQHYASRAEAYHASGNLDAAAKDLAHVDWLQELSDLNLRIARTSRDADLWALRGKHMLTAHRLNEAKQSFQNALTLVPAHQGALVGRAVLAMENDEFQAAVQDCTDALKREFSYETYSLRGDAHFSLGQFSEAITDYESARRMDERVVEAYRQRAAQHRTSGEEKLAQADEKFAEGLIKRMSEAAAQTKQAAPREMVIEQTSYETTSPSRPAREVK